MPDIIEVYRNGPVYKVREVEEADISADVVKRVRKNGMGDSILKILYDCVNQANREDPEKREQRLRKELSIMFG